MAAPLDDVVVLEIDNWMAAPSAGVIESIHAAEGDVVEVGAVLARMLDDAQC